MGLQQEYFEYYTVVIVVLVLAVHTNYVEMYSSLTCVQVNIDLAYDLMKAAYDGGINFFDNAEA